ncbi:MAG: phosphoribosylglycinamide formyltransferase [Clostridiales bacterium]|jgi:phosphoribosylglycinamide formyltransferase-1|nr:phosphoribosylglycinamide formyltransferase [Clostridiales bacterium]
MRLGVLVSGFGSNLQAIIEAIINKKITNSEIAIVVSNNEEAYALKRAKKYKLQSEIVCKKNNTDEIFDDIICEIMKKNKVDLIVMAGFLAIIGKKILIEFDKKIINVHPSLIPSFCGKGMYGIRVHEEALKRGVKITGATVHYVDDTIDGGKIIFQKTVKVNPNDTPTILQKRVMKKAEHVILPMAIEKISNERYFTD